MTKSDVKSDEDDFAILTGQTDFVRWRRELHERADYEDITYLIYRDEEGNMEPLLENPGQPPSVSMFGESKVHEYNAILETYKFSHKQYTKQQERRKTAKKLVMKSVDASIRP